MMKIQRTRSIVLIVFTMAGLSLNAQDASIDTTIVMDPAMFVPADTGYFLAGVDKDLIGNDGVTEHYDGCYDAYGDSDHKESWTQNGWEYGNVIIFRGCNTDLGVLDDVIKGSVPTENWPTVGNIIQIRKHKYALTDSASYGYLISPEFTEISSLVVKVGTDVSINNSRSIWMMIEASKDGGETWEYVDNPEGTAFVYQQLTNQGGDIHTYTAETDSGFDEIIAASKSGAIQLRFTSFPPPFSDPSTANGERLKFWEITIEAKTVVKEEEAVLASVLKEPSFQIQNGELVARKGTELKVYTLLGRLVGAGNHVPICDKGVYIVRSSDGTSKKLLLQ